MLPHGELYGLEVLHMSFTSSDRLMCVGL
jgi:hypothetical protein